MRCSPECSAPSPERAARAGARRPRGAAGGADPAEPRGGAGTPGHGRESSARLPLAALLSGGSAPAPSSSPFLLPGPERDKQGWPSALRPLPARPHRARQLRAMARPGPAAVPGPGGAGAPRGRGEGSGAGDAPAPGPLRARLLTLPAGSSRRERNFCSDLKLQLLCLFISPAAVAGCQARRPCLLKTHFSCPARSSSLLAALSCSVKIKALQSLLGGAGGGWERGRRSSARFTRPARGHRGLRGPRRPPPLAGIAVGRGDRPGSPAKPFPALWSRGPSPAAKR